MSLKQLQQRLIRILAIVVALAILVTLGVYGVRRALGYNFDSSFFEKDLAAGVQADENITNFALFGLDTRAGDVQSHSDCMMIVTVDNTRGKVKLTSLMRDSLVEIDGYGANKLNAAYFLGGPELAVRTINQCFGTDIRDYVSIDFEQLSTIIDALDGVEIDVQSEELEELNRVIEDYGLEQGKTFNSVASAGVQKLDGVQAMCYGRIRKGGTGDDWGRVERQSIVLQALFDSVKSLTPSKAIGLAQKLLPNVTTSLSPTALAPLIVGLLKNGTPEIEHTRVPLDTEWEYGGSENEYIVYNLDTAADHIRSYIYDDVMPGSSATPDNATGTPMGDVDLDTEPTAPPTTTQPPQTDDPASSGTDSDNGQASGQAPTQTDDPASLVEEGGRYDAETGDYYDSDGDRYYLDDSGTRVYYAQ